LAGQPNLTSATIPVMVTTATRTGGGIGTNQYAVRGHAARPAPAGAARLRTQAVRAAQPETVERVAASDIVARYRPIDAHTWEALRAARPLNDPYYAALLDDIATNGITNPVWLTTAGTVDNGHSRILIAEHLGIDVPVVHDVDLTAGVPEHWARYAAVDARGLTMWNSTLRCDVPVTEADLDFDYD
jgi:hypothetical protein